MKKIYISFCIFFVFSTVFAQVKNTQIIQSLSSVKNTVTAKDFPEPLPPVIIKYLASDSNNALYFLFSISFYKFYYRHINWFIA